MLKLFTFLILLGSLFTPNPVHGFQGGKPQDLPLEPLGVQTEHGLVEFQVQMARTADQQRTGLMFRMEMPDTEGMFFPYRYPQRVSFWMRNTYIPLDIIFIYPDGVIANIEAMTTPLSLDAVRAAGHVNGVLEINGGLAEKLGIKVGDKIIHPHYDGEVENE